MNRTLILSFPIESSPGGGERYLEQVVAGLRKKRRFALVSSSRALLKVFHARGWEHLPLWGGIEPVSRISFPLFLLTIPLFLPIQLAVLAYARFHDDARSMLCLSMTDKLLATLPARLLGMRVLWLEHLVAGPALLRNPLRGLYAALSRLARVVAVSEAVAASLAAAGVPRSRMEVVAPGVEPGEYERAEPHRGAPVIACIARLHREKNVALLIRAFARVHAEIPEARLVIFGDGPERGALERLAAALGLGSVVEFRGYVKDAGRRCGDFDILAVPSSREAFGIAALEAMACGVPVIATRVGGLPELVLDGETGLLVPPEDEKALAETLTGLLRDPERAARLGAAGRERALTRFTVAKMLSAWDRLLSS